MEKRRDVRYSCVTVFLSTDKVYNAKKYNKESKDHNKEDIKNNIVIKKDDTIKTQNNDEIEVSKTITEVNTLIEEDWITVKNTTIKIRVVREAIQKAYI